MYKIEINTINAQADNDFFNGWLRQNYEYYLGFSKGSNLTISFSNEPSSQKKIDIESFYNSITEDECLSIYKTKKIVDIKAKTDYLIASNGFPFDTSNGVLKNFPLTREVNGLESSNPQTNILALYTSRSQITYPIIFNTIDNLHVFNCLNPESIESMYLSALQTKKNYLDSETNILNEVRLSTTKLDLDLIIDNR